MGNPGDKVMISPSGNIKNPEYVLEKPDGSAQVDMFFSSPEKAKEYANSKKLIVVDKTIQEAKMKKNIKQQAKIKALTSLLEKYSGKKVTLKESYHNDDSFITSVNSARELLDSAHAQIANAKGVSPEASNDSNLNKAQQFINSALNSLDLF